MSYDWPFWYDQGITEDSDWSSLTFIKVFPTGTFANGPVKPEDLPPPLGYVLVIEPARVDAKYKIEGGHKERGEMPQHTAVRETTGETGLVLAENLFGFIDREERLRPARHWSVLFCAHVEESEVPWINDGHPGNEGEKPEFVRAGDFRTMLARGTFLGYHALRLRHAGLI